MKIAPQTREDLARLAALLEPMSVAMLTTAAADGALLSRPMQPLELDAQGALWFFTHVNSSKTDQLAQANLSFADVPHASYVSLSGRGEIVTDRGHIERLWTAAARPWFPQGAQSPELALLKFTPHSAEVWDAPDSRMVRLFSMAASVAAGKPVGMGDHERLTDLDAAAQAPRAR